MDTFNYPIIIADLDGTQSREIEVRVGTGTFFTILPRPLLREIGIEPTDTRYVPLADGQSAVQEIGHAQVTLDDEQGITIVVFGDDDSRPLLGRYTLTGLCLEVDPDNQRLVPFIPLLATPVLV